MIFSRETRKQVILNTQSREDVNAPPGKLFERIDGTSAIAGGASGAGGSGTHKAYPVADAGLGKTIDCYLDTDLTGDVVTVNCSIMNGSSLNSASPLLEKASDPIFITQIDSEWYCQTVFQRFEECECTAP